MLLPFNFPGKDTRLVRCGSTLYKVTVQSSGDPNRFSESNVLCDENTLQTEIQSAMDTVIAMTRRAKLHQFRTDHLVFTPSRKPWKTSSLLKFSQDSELLYAHAYILVITVDSCQRFLQKQNPPHQDGTNQLKRRAADKDLFVVPAPKYPTTSKRRRTQRGGLSTPSTVASSSSVLSRKRTPALDDAFFDIMKDYATSRRKAVTPGNFSAVKARKIICNIAEQLRPASGRSRGMITPIASHTGDRTKGPTVQPDKLADPRGVPTQGNPCPNEDTPHTPRSQRYYLRQRPSSSSPDITKVAKRPRRRSKSSRSHPVEESASTRELSSPEGIYEKPKTRSRDRSTKDESQNSSFLSMLLTPFKRFLPK